jgi:hypothetical protein
LESFRKRRFSSRISNPHFSQPRAKWPNTRAFRRILAFTVLA